MREVLGDYAASKQHFRRVDGSMPDDLSRRLGWLRICIMYVSMVENCARSSELDRNLTRAAKEKKDPIDVMTSDNAFPQWLQISGHATQEMAEKRKAEVAAAVACGAEAGWGRRGGASRR